MSGPRPRYLSFVHDSARWDGFKFRAGDIIISTPPKCGTTWMQMICSLLIFQDPEREQRLAMISPWLDMLVKKRDAVYALLEAQAHRRFIKTHTPLDGLPEDDRVTYVCVGRDPRDVAVSWDNHQANLDMDAFLAVRAKAVGTEGLEELVALDPPFYADTLRERFWHWVDNPAAVVHATCSLRSTLDHFDQALRASERPNVVVFHYADLKADLGGEMRRVADRLGISVPDDRWPALVAAASFERMRSRADELAPNTSDGIWKENRQFFHSGTGGHWREFFDDEAQRRYDARVVELAAPAVASWAHH